MKDGLAVRVWHDCPDAPLGVDDAVFRGVDAVDLIPERGGPFVRVNFRLMEVQTVEEGCVTDRATFDWGRLVALVREGFPLAVPLNDGEGAA